MADVIKSGKNFKIEVDISALKQLLYNFYVKLPALTIPGVNKALELLRDDAWNKVPKVPYLTGHLHDSHRIIPAKKVVEGVEGELVVETPYAASLHEGISRHGTPYTYYAAGTGAKWIETKLLAYYNKYIKAISDELHK